MQNWRPAMAKNPTANRLRADGVLRSVQIDLGAPWGNDTIELPYLTASPSNETELAFLHALQLYVRRQGDTWLARLLTNRLIEWAAEQIRDDQAPDLMAVYDDARALAEIHAKGLAGRDSVIEGQAASIQSLQRQIDFLEVCKADGESASNERDEIARALDSLSASYNTLQDTYVADQTRAADQMQALGQTIQAQQQLAHQLLGLCAALAEAASAAVSETDLLRATVHKLKADIYDMALAKAPARADLGTQVANLRAQVAAYTNHVGVSDPDSL